VKNRTRIELPYRTGLCFFFVGHYLERELFPSRQRGGRAQAAPPPLGSPGIGLLAGAAIQDDQCPM